MKIKNIKIIDKPEKVYNLHVQKNHNYIANGIVAHNCHQSKSTEIQKVITETFKNVPIKWGLTGTIPKEKSEYYCLLTSLGDKAVSVKSHELQEKGFMASCNINCIRLMDDAVFMDYEDEVNYLSTDDKRLSYIATLIKNIADSGNTLVLLNRIVTGEILERKLNNLGADVVFLQGSVSIKKRKEEYKEVNTVNNKCILATAQIAATGINIPRLFNLVILDFGKSFTRSIQSIGRVLRLAKDKTSANVFDISSILKYSRRHFNERIKYYDDEQHPYHIYKIDNWKNNS
jgi:superfamily II DNA or RNA helicase